MADFIISAILVVIVACIIRYLYKEKKSGATCIGCPHAKQCGGGCNHASGHEHKHGHGECTGCHKE